MPALEHPLSSSPHVIAWADLIAVPWLNGGGVTRQILSRSLAASGGADSDDWDWRVSIADVGTAGAFSDFTGMTRILTVIEGESITLTVDGVEEELERFRPFRFDGGVDTSAQLPHGPIRDLNLIARTSRVNGDVRIENFSASQPLTVGDGQFCVLLAGDARLVLGDRTEQALQHFDTVIGAPSHSVSIQGEGTLAIITVSATAEPAVT